MARPIYLRRPKTVRSKFTGEIGKLLRTKQELPDEPELGLVEWDSGKTWHRVHDLEVVKLAKRSGKDARHNAKVRKLFAENLARVRLNKGWTQAELAVISGVSLQQIGNYELGRRSITLETFGVLCVALKTSPADLLEGLAFAV